MTIDEIKNYLAVLRNFNMREAVYNAKFPLTYNYYLGRYHAYDDALAAINKLDESCKVLENESWREV